MGFTYKFGAMSSTKTRDLLAVDYNFRVDNQLDSYVIKPSSDNRDGDNIIKSRDGGERIVDLVAYPHTNLFKEVEKRLPDIVLVDEINFFKKHQVIELRRIVDELDIPVICWGIKSDAFNEPFEGSTYAFIYADKFEQLKTICRLCTKSATMNIRLLKGKPIFYGQQILVGSSDKYMPVCSKCYHQCKRESEGDSQ